MGAGPELSPGPLTSCRRAARRSSQLSAPDWGLLRARQKWQTAQCRLQTRDDRPETAVEPRDIPARPAGATGQMSNENLIK